jgi:hypothetical protein
LPAPPGAKAPSELAGADRIKVEEKEMRTRSLWLLGGLLIVAAGAVFIGHSALATPTLLDLEALGSFPSGGETDLLVTVDPIVVGGYAELYSKTRGYRAHVLTFPIDSESFTITAPIPDDPSLIGNRLFFRYTAYDIAGNRLGVSVAALGPIVEPDVEDY